MSPQEASGWASMMHHQRVVLGPEPVYEPRAKRMALVDLDSHAFDNHACHHAAAPLLLPESMFADHQLEALDLSELLALDTSAAPGAAAAPAAAVEAPALLLDAAPASVSSASTAGSPGGTGDGLVCGCCDKHRPVLKTRPYCETCRHFVAASIGAYCLFAPHPAIHLTSGPQDQRFLEAMRVTRYLSNPSAMDRLQRLFPLSRAHLTEFYERLFRLDLEVAAAVHDLRALAGCDPASTPPAAVHANCAHVCAKLQRTIEQRAVEQVGASRHRSKPDKDRVLYTDHVQTALATLGWLGPAPAWSSTPTVLRQLSWLADIAEGAEPGILPVDSLTL